MMGNYPAGAYYDEYAPYNRAESGYVDKDMDLVVSLSFSATIEVSEDAENDEFISAFSDQYPSITEMLGEYAGYLRTSISMLESRKPDGWAERAKELRKKVSLIGCLRKEEVELDLEKQ